MQSLKTITLLLLLLVLGCDGPYFKIPKEPDSTAPILTITNPADQATVTDTVLISVYAFDNDELELVELFLNNETVLSQNVEPFEYLSLLWIFDILRCYSVNSIEGSNPFETLFPIS